MTKNGGQTETFLAARPEAHTARTHFGGVFVGGSGRAVGVRRVEAGPVHVTVTNFRLIQHFLPAVHLIVYFL